jgi:hypothetical protein
VVVGGAIMDFAVSAKTSGFDIHKTGVILLLVGIALFVVRRIVPDRTRPILTHRGQDERQEARLWPGSEPE